MAHALSDCFVPAAADDDDMAIKYNRNRRKYRRLPRSTKIALLSGIGLLALFASVMSVSMILNEGRGHAGKSRHLELMSDLLHQDHHQRTLSRIVSGYYATSTNPSKAEKDIRKLFSSEEEEMVEELLEMAKNERSIHDGKHTNRHPHVDTEESLSRRHDDHEGDGQKSTLDKHLKHLEYVADHCLGDEDVVVDFGDLHNDHSRAQAVEKAQDILRNCKLLVLRNALPRDFVQHEVIPKTSFYLNGISSGRVSHGGTTTNGEQRYYFDRYMGRWEVLLPESLVNETKKELVMNAIFLDILKKKNLLGEDVALMSAGINFAAPGAVGQHWHEDEGYLLDTDSWEDFGIAGHDTPSVAVTVSVPLLDVTPEHGPTEFCLGSSALQGFGSNGFDKEFVEDHVSDKTLVAEGSAYERFTRYGDETCHPHFWKSPILQKGDVLMFDYQLRHRGGWNTHEHDARAIMFFTYSRYWFKDSNFEADVEVQDDEWHIMRSARMARPENWDEYRKEHYGLKPPTEVTDVDAIERFDADGISESLFWKGNHDFIVSNKDIEESNVKLFLNERELGPLGKEQTMQVSQTILEGDRFSLRSNGNKLYEYPAAYDGQVVFHSRMERASFSHS